MLEGLNKKTMIIAGSSVVGLIIVVIIISAIVNALVPKYLSYGEFETKLGNAAKNYYKANPALLPTNDGETSIYYSTLQEGGYIGPINKLLENGDSCTAQVIVINFTDNYSYIPYLTCPGEYESKEMYKAILQDNKVVTEGKGLYRDSESYYFRGEVDNNYVKLDESLWRIVKINNDNTVTIIATTALEDSEEWDDRYNLDEEDRSGYNDFEVSRIRDMLIDLVKDPEVLSDNAKMKLTPRALCIGKRAEADTDTSGSIECTTMTEDKYLYGFIAAYEFMAASLDENCDQTTSKSCTNYNFLASSTVAGWTVTGLSEDTRNVYKYSRLGLRRSSASSSAKLFLTANISKRAFYKSGIGTKEDPYIIR